MTIGRIMRCHAAVVINHDMNVILYRTTMQLYNKVMAFSFTKGRVKMDKVFDSTKQKLVIKDVLPQKYNKKKNSEIINLSVTGK